MTANEDSSKILLSNVNTKSLALVNNRRPGPSILKIKKRYTGSLSETKSSKQCSISPGHNITLLSNDPNNTNGNKEEKIIKVTATIVLPTTKTAANTLKTFTTTTKQISTNDCINTAVSNGDEIISPITTSTDVATSFGITLIPINTVTTITPLVPTKLVTTLTTTKTSTTVLVNANTAIISSGTKPAITNVGPNSNSRIQTLNYSLTTATKTPIASSKVTLDSNSSKVFNNNKSTKVTNPASSTQFTTFITKGVPPLHGNSTIMKRKPIRTNDTETEMSALTTATKLVGDTPVTQLIVSTSTTVNTNISPVITASTISKSTSLTQNPQATVISTLFTTAVRAVTTSTIKFSNESHPNQIRSKIVCNNASPLIKTAIKSNILNVTASLPSTSINLASMKSNATVVADQVLLGTSKIEKITKPASNGKATITETTLITSANKPQVTYVVKDIPIKPATNIEMNSKNTISATNNIYNKTTMATQTFTKIPVTIMSNNISKKNSDFNSEFSSTTTATTNTLTKQADIVDIVVATTSSTASTSLFSNSTTNITTTTIGTSAPITTTTASK